MAVDGNKLTIDFDKAGQKRVLDGFVRGREAPTVRTTLDVPDWLQT